MKVYTTFSIWQFCLVTLARIGYLGVISYAFYHLNENVIVTILVVIPCVFFLTITGYDILEVTYEEIIIKSTKPVQILRGARRFSLDKIYRMEVQGDFETSDELYSPKQGEKNWANTIILTLDNKVETISTNIYINKLRTAKKLVDELLGRRQRKRSEDPQSFKHQ